MAFETTLTDINDLVVRFGDLRILSFYLVKKMNFIKNNSAINIFINLTCLLANNFYIWWLAKHYCYLPKNEFHLIKYSFLAFICNIGLFMSTTKWGMKFKKINLILILPSLLISPMLIFNNLFLLPFLIVLSAILSLLKLKNGSIE
jgi:hypothetical protein